MPNWCMNRLEVSHPDITKMQNLIEGFKKGEFFHSIRPMPEEIRNTESPPREENEELRKKYGVTNWFDWSLQNWGTKWDTGEEDDLEIEPYGDTLSVQCSFETAWSPPDAIYEYMVEQGYTIEAYYYEPGVGFCGSVKDGETDHYDITNLTSEEVEDQIPYDIDIRFGISDWLAECEREAEEEENE